MVSPKATEIPTTPGFYAVSESKTTKTEPIYSDKKKIGDRLYYTAKTTIYARLEDGSLVRVDTRKKSGQTVDMKVGEGLTHEQKIGAQKLSKEMDIPYEQALGLVSARAATMTKTL